MDDLIVGASLSDPSGKSNAGKSYVVFGKTDNTAINLSAIASGTGGFVIIGENEDDLSGYSVSTAGDVNGDGLDDLIVSSDGADPSGKSNAGKSYANNLCVLNSLSEAVGSRGDSNLVHNFYLARYFQRLLRFFNLKSNLVILALLKR